MPAGAALVALLCVCGVLVGTVWRKRSDRVPVEVCSHSPNDDGSDKVTWSMMRPVEPIPGGIAGFTEANSALGLQRGGVPHAQNLLTVQGSASSASSAPGQREYWVGPGIPAGSMPHSHTQSLARLGSKDHESSWCGTMHAAYFHSYG